MERQDEEALAYSSSDAKSTIRIPLLATSSVATDLLAGEKEDVSRAQQHAKSATDGMFRQYDRPGFNIRASSNGFMSDSYRVPTVAMPPMIDNRHLVYFPIYLRKSRVTLQCRPDVLTDCPQVLRFIESDLCQCLELLPRSVHPLVRRTRIWIHTSYCYGRIDRPNHVGHSTVHHTKTWLRAKADNAKKVGGVEIYSASQYCEMRLHWNGCGLLLHELSHLIHQHCLNLQNVEVQTAYEQARSSGKYETVLRRDWAGQPSGETDMAYAMVNQKEFFAEMSVTYLCNNYLYLEPVDSNFVFTPKNCPPILSPTVAARVPVALQHERTKVDQSLPTVKSPWSMFRWFLQKSRPPLVPCNKFYPFTRQQLEAHDPKTFAIIRDLWENDIVQWEDPKVRRGGCRRRKTCCWRC